MTEQQIAIAGASGVVGRRVLEALLEQSGVGRVTAVGRRLLAVKHPKLDSKVASLQSASALVSAIPEGVSVAICCLGTTLQQAGSKAAFRAVDYEAVVAFAKAALKQGARRFVLVSSLGADRQSRAFYLKVKGEAERELERMHFAELVILRPAFIDDQGTRTDHRWAERLMLPVAKAVFSVVGRQRRYAPIGADRLGRAVVRLALDGSTEQVRILESEQIQAAGQL